MLFPLRARAAYDLWASTYDQVEGNLMLALDREVFGYLLDRVDLYGKKVADIGCGTGRHWQAIYEAQPALLEGFDVSMGMLSRLREKFPRARTNHVADPTLPDVPDQSFDALVSTLTIAHIRDLKGLFHTWGRILRPGGDLLVTDFHPAALARGGKRTFSHEGRTVSIRNYIHPLDAVRQAAALEDIALLARKELSIQPSHRPYYAGRNALDVYVRFLHTPMIYGLHLKKKP